MFNNAIDTAFAKSKDRTKFSLAKTLKEKYRFYVVIEYDSQGNRNIKDIYGADKNKLQSLLYNNIYNRSYGSYDATLVPIKDMTYVYAVPNELIAQDNISYMIQNGERYSYSLASQIYVNIALLFVTIASLSIPYSKTKELKIINKMQRLPIEVVIILLIPITVAFIYGFGIEGLIPETIAGDFLNLEILDLNNDAKATIMYSLNVVYWTLCFIAVFICVFLIKNIFKTGVFRYIKENSIIIKIFKSIYRYSKKFIGNLMNIDLKEKNNKKLITLLLINLIIISIMCITWFFGIGIAVIYTIALYIIIKNKYSKISEEYNKLFKITSEIANGNLDIKLDEDLGMFNSLKDEIENIQTGFKKAVEEEVKSQKMKTELISNVSHDLKTPLTSIITYVDLLKDKNLSEEKREEYLHTLDRKSQRLQILIEDLFEVSKANSKNVTLNIQEVDVVSLMKQTLFELDDKITKSNLTLRTNLPEEKVTLNLDGARMFRVFENLIVNITKYAMPGSRVYIDIIRNEEKVQIIFKNMTAEEMNIDAHEITERFVRGDKSRNTEGSGLGLAIAKSFVELQGGNLEISIDGDLFKVVISF